MKVTYTIIRFATEKMAKLGNNLIDVLIETNGVEWVIKYLIEWGLTIDEMVSIGFIREDLEERFESLDLT